MSLIQRKPRPLTRDSSGFRDDRLFIVACDDTYAPQQYFNLFQIPRVKIFVVNTPAGEPSSSEYVLHPGRKFAEKLADGGMSQEFLTQRVSDYFAGRPLAKLPKVIAQQQAEEKAEAEQRTDEV